MTSYRFLVERHLELVEVEPLKRVLMAEVVVVVPRREAERVKLPLGGEQEDGRGLLVDHPRVAPLPARHHVDAVGVVNETERVAAERRT